MGMNYYIQTNACPTCGHVPERLHIGKSSSGWPFLFEAHKFNDKPSIMSYEDIEHYVLKLGYLITNEDHDQLTLPELKKIVDSHPENSPHKWERYDYNNYLDKFGYKWHLGEFS